ncbi:MAG: mercury resistance system transport protein MerF [Hoeflea sp.]
MLLHTRVADFVRRLGLSADVGYLDLVLLPALAAFVLLTIYALWKRRAA